MGRPKLSTNTYINRINTYPGFNFCIYYCQLVNAKNTNSTFSYAMFTNSGINKVFLVGNISKEPSLHNFEDQREVLCFPLVTNEVIKKNGVNTEVTEWHNIKISKEVAATTNLQLQKGHLLYIEGKIQTRSFYDDDRIKKYKLEIIVIKFQVLNVVPNLKNA